MQMFLDYESPQIEVEEVDVERGFAATGDGDANGDIGDMPWG